MHEGRVYPLRGKNHGQVKRSYLAKDWASSYTRARIPAPDGVLVGTWALSCSPRGSLNQVRAAFPRKLIYNRRF